MAPRAILLATLAALVGCGGPPPASLTEQGLLELRAGQYDQAIASCTEALEANPDDDEAYLYRGRAYHFRNAKGDPQRAIADFGEAIRLAPKSADAYYSRALVFRDLGETKLADADDEKARAVDEGLQNIIRQMPSQSAPEVAAEPEPPSEAPLATGESLPEAETDRREMFEELQKEFEPSASRRRAAEKKRAADADSRAERSRRSLYRELDEPVEPSWTTTTPPPATRDPRALQPITPPGDTSAGRQRTFRPSPTSPFGQPGAAGLGEEFGLPGETRYSPYPPPVRSPFAPRQQARGAAQPANPFGPGNPGVGVDTGQGNANPYRYSNPAVRPVNPRDYVP
jgi:hypothetical protein